MTIHPDRTHISVRWCHNKVGCTPPKGRMVVNTLVLITVPHLDRKLLDTALLMPGTQNDQNASSTVIFSMAFQPRG